MALEQHLDLPRTPRFAEWFLESTTEGRAVVDRARADLAEKRRALREEHATILAARDKQTPLLAKKNATAKAAYEKALAALNAASADYQRAHRELQGMVSRFEIDLHDIEKQIKAVADPDMLAALDRLDDEERRLQKTQVRYSTKTTHWASITNQPARGEIMSNAPSVYARLRAIIAGRGRIQEAAYSPDISVTETLRDVLDNLPDPTVLVPVETYNMIPERERGEYADA